MPHGRRPNRKRARPAEEGGASAATTRAPSPLARRPKKRRAPPRPPAARAAVVSPAVGTARAGVDGTAVVARAARDEPRKPKRAHTFAPVVVEQPNWARLQQMLHGAAAPADPAALGPTTSGARHADEPAQGDAAPPAPPRPAPTGLIPDVPLTDKLGLDCEMVGVGPDGERSVLARVVLVNWDGRTVYDAMVRPRERVRARAALRSDALLCARERRVAARTRRAHVTATSPPPPPPPPLARSSITARG